MRIAPSFFAAAAVACFALAGCSSSTSEPSSSTSFDPGVSSSKSVDELTASEVTTICQASRDYLGRVLGGLDAKQFSCNLQASFTAISAQSDAEAQSLCKTAHDSCVASYKPSEAAPGTGTSAKPCDGEDDTSLKKACAGKGVTVGEVAACSEESTGTFKVFGSADFCSNVKLGASAAAAYSGPACSAVVKKCPGAFDGTTD